MKLNLIEYIICFVCILSLAVIVSMNREVKELRKDVMFANFVMSVHSYQESFVEQDFPGIEK